MMKKKLFLFVISLIIGVIGGGKSYATDYLTNFSDYTETKTAVSNTGASGNTQEYWRGGILSFDVSGVSTTLPNGVYSFSVQAVYRGHYTKDIPTGIIAYAESDGTQYMTPICNYTDGPAPSSVNPAGFDAVFSADANNFLNTIPYIIVTDGKIKVGVKSMSTQPFCDNGMWFLFNKTSFKVSDVTDDGILATALADIKAQATGLLASNSDVSDERSALQTAASTTEATAANIVDIKQKIDAYLAKLVATATNDNPNDVSYYFTNPKYAIRNLDLVGGLVTSGKTGALGQPFGWTCFDAGGTVDDGSGNCFQDGQGFNWFSTTGNTTEIDGRTANYDAEKTGGYSIYQRISWNQWAEQTHSAKQTVTLPAGKYKISVPAYSSANNDDYKGHVNFTVGDTPYNNTVDANAWNVYEKTFIITEETNVSVELQFNKLRRDQNLGAAWAFFDGVTLTAYGDPLNDLKDELATIQGTATSLLSNDTYINIVGTERSTLTTQSTATAAAETAEAYQTAIDNVQAAIDAFTGAKANYDALVAEIAKAKALGVATATADGYAATSTTTTATALTNTKNLKVAEYNYVISTYQYGVTLGIWSTTGYTTDNSGQHWDGKSSTQYKEQENSWGDPKKGYAADSWTIAFDQSIELPAGNYIFKVAGRKAVGTKTTMSLDVTKTSDDSSLGSVNDFPEGDTGLGINKAGATSFDPEDAAGFANNNAGRGWEWRYVKFTLSEPTTVKIAVNAEATDYSQWMSFCNYTLQTDNEANISLIAYNIALNDANAAINSTDYKNVTGSERTELQALINGDATLDKTNKTAIDAAKSSLETKTTAFTDAKDAYDAFVAAKTNEYQTSLPYASATKLETFNTAKSATATNATDATTKTAAIISAYRKYVESNALAEGVDGAEAVVISDPNMEVTYDGTNHKFGEWQVIGQVEGNIQLLSGESFTDGDGKHDYKYADIYKNDNNAGIQQTVNLEAGTYILTVTARAQNTAGATFHVFAGTQTKSIERIGNTGGVFDRGWNDCTLEFEVPEKSDVNIGVQSGNGKDLWWSATRFRLMKIKEGANMKITDAKWATFIAPFDVTIPDGVTAYTIEGIKSDNETLNKTKLDTTIPANTPVLLNKEVATDQVYSETFYGVNTATENSYTEGLLTGVYTAQDATPGTYVLQKQSSGVNFYKVASGEGNQPVIGKNRAYLTAPASAKILFFDDDDEEPTAIEGIDIAADDYDAIYTPTGVKVESLQKGLNIVVKGEKSYKIFVK